ncbi:GATOR1 complex protein NPRL2-like [Watersipora subatra]|uniref:GATOR1 complex protein NPRL2-like n=1 Tax=Watersipora subatra TaxID=2589382 RepID=UPI00355AE025
MPHSQVKIQSIFFCWFDERKGPQIFIQVPEGSECVNDAAFHSIQNYLIPREELQQKLITVKAFGHKILGCPVHIKNSNYSRNAFIFNVCFVFKPNANTKCYERVLKKLVQYFTVLEMESNYLSRLSPNIYEEPPAEKKFFTSLREVLSQVMERLNSTGCCAIPIDEANTIHLKLVPIYDTPLHIVDHDVPILTVKLSEFHSLQWDLTTQQVLPHIDGFKHVALVAAEAGKDVQLVKTLLENLLYFQLIKIIPIFQYSNVYMITADIQRLYKSKDLQAKALQAVKLPNKPEPTFDDVLKIYSCFTHGTMMTVKNVCLRLCPQTEMRIDVKKLIQFGVVNGLLRRIHKYPVRTSDTYYAPETAVGTPYLRYCDGLNSYDEICCALGITYEELDKNIEENPTIHICWK